MLTESIYRSCTLCPRECHADRTTSTGFCGAGHELRAARAALHMWEEPCISGTTGSGTVFFSGCTLRCVFCQNFQLSHENYGKTISVSRLSDIFLELQEKGEPADLAKIAADIEDRDYRDMHRDISPLRQAEDATLVDSSDMTIDQVVERILELCR